VQPSSFAWRTLLVVLALLAASATFILAAPRGGFHPAAMPCEGCHLAGKSVTPGQAHLLIASQERLCGSCHPKALQVSHPSGFAPRSKPPADYPLDWKGDLTCSTCHEVHGKAPGMMRGSRRRRELCLSCHDAKFFDRMKDQGASMMISGHLDAGNTMQTAGLDAYSVQCMECHDSKGDSNALSIDRNMIVRHDTGAANHPIAVKYAEVARGGGYRPVEQLSKRILLPNGRLSCVSCHDGYNGNHGKLVAMTTGSSLCFECHDL
jgi:predicted CXXCH cytochrome family protein